MSTDKNEQQERDERLIRWWYAYWGQHIPKRDREEYERSVKEGLDEFWNSEKREP